MVYTRVSLKEPITFNLGWNYYYYGECYSKMMAIGQSFNLSRLCLAKTEVGIGHSKDHLVIHPDDYEQMDVRFVVKDKPSIPTEISTEEYEIWKKRFGFTIEELAKPLLARAIYSALLEKVDTDILETEYKLSFTCAYDERNLAMLSTPEFDITLFIPHAEGIINRSAFNHDIKEKAESPAFEDGYVKILKTPYTLLKTDVLTPKDSQSKDRLQPTLDFD